MKTLDLSREDFELIIQTLKNERHCILRYQHPSPAKDKICNHLNFLATEIDKFINQEKK